MLLGIISVLKTEYNKSYPTHEARSKYIRRHQMLTTVQLFYLVYSSAYPNVCLWPVIFSALKQLRSCIWWAPTPCWHHLSGFIVVAEPKIWNLKHIAKTINIMKFCHMVQIWSVSFFFNQTSGCISFVHQAYKCRTWGHDLHCIISAWCGTPQTSH
jgi:hypothetical protein